MHLRVANATEEDWHVTWLLKDINTRNAMVRGDRSDAAVMNAKAGRVIRIQDDDGRGPFKPGFSHVWCDDSGPPQLVPWFQEFPGLLPRVRKAVETYHVGCGCRTVEQIERWFTPTERMRLRLLGYKLVAMDVDRVLAESRNQLVFLRDKPLNEAIEVLELG